MDPDETATRYDRIAGWWKKEMLTSEYGLSQLARAIGFAEKHGAALDVGCGSEGRFLKLLAKEGFSSEGLDISKEMVAMISGRHPSHTFYCADICGWEFPKCFDLISAWDSIFHLPLDRHAPVLEKLCGGLAEGGVLLFTCGGGDAPGEITGSFAGETFGYSTLGVAEFLRLLTTNGCAIKHVEYDQYPENHVVIIARKEPSS